MARPKDLRARGRHLLLTGMMFPMSALHTDGMTFDQDRPYRACLICGTIYQREYHRTAGPEMKMQVFLDLQEWANKHARTHPDWQHRQLRASGSLCTPEAAQRLAQFGIIPMTDIVLDEEVEHALLVASSTPTDDAEGGG